MLLMLLFGTAAVLGDVKAVVVVVETAAADRNAADINFIIAFCICIYNMSLWFALLSYYFFAPLCSLKLNE